MSEMDMGISGNKHHKLANLARVLISHFIIYETVK